MIITKIFRVESSHRVLNAYSERCKYSYHGHSYVIELSLKANKLDNAQMVMDFGALKEGIKPFIDSMDHCHVISAYDDEECVDFFQKHNARWIHVPFNPTAEMLAVWIFAFSKYILEHTLEVNGEDRQSLKVYSVKVHETVTGSATAYEEDVKNLWNDLWTMHVGFSDGVLKDWPQQLKNIFFKDPAGNIALPKVKQQTTFEQ